MGVDAVGVGQGELGQGLLPVGDDLAFDEPAGGFALVGGLAAFLVAFAGALVLDVADRQPEQLDHGVVVGEVAAVLGDLAQLVVQRLDRVGGVDDSAQLGRERQERDEPVPGVGEDRAPCAGIFCPSGVAANASSAAWAAWSLAAV